MKGLSFPSTSKSLQVQSRSRTWQARRWASSANYGREVVRFDAGKLRKKPLKLLNAVSSHTEFSSIWYSHRSQFFRYERVGQRASFAVPRKPGRDDLAMLIALAESGTKTNQIVRLSPSGGDRHVHQYLQTTALGTQPLLGSERAGLVLLDQFKRFPSLSRTKLSKDNRKAILNLADHVTLSPVRVLRHGRYRVFFIEAITEEVHALAGQLDHMLFQHLDTGKTYLVRPGVGHLLGLDTPGAGALDHANDIIGACSWVLASRFASPLLSGDYPAIERLERAYGLRLARVFFTAGGIASRNIVQPIQRVTFPRTPETVFGGYLIALLVLFVALSAYTSREDEVDEPKEGPDPW